MKKLNDKQKEKEKETVEKVDATHALVAFTSSRTSSTAWSTEDSFFGDTGGGTTTSLLNPTSFCFSDSSINTLPSTIEVLLSGLTGSGEASTGAKLAEFSGTDP
jgi:hypothetical protein